MEETRSEPRQSKAGYYSLTWKHADGNRHSAEGAGLDVSPSGLGIECSTDLPEGAIIYVQARDGSLAAECEVVHCTPRDGKFYVGFELRDEALPGGGDSAAQRSEADDADYYEILQISRKAESDTIHRVFRIMAVRFHPDNPETGNLETFLRMKRAHAVLADPERRSLYDASLEKSRESGPRPAFADKSFVTGVEAESNRRLGLLSLLYNQRQTDPEHPSVSLLDLEREMGFPREYLNFTTWYLRAKEFVVAADSCDYVITAAGADFVEKNAGRNKLMGKLLQPGAPRVRRSANQNRRPKETRGEASRRLLV